MVVKGVPAMLSDIHSLYAHEGKVAVIEEMLLKMQGSLEKDMVLWEGDEEESDPTVLVWVYYFLAQHFYFKGDLKQALSFIEKGVNHTPTLIDIYTLKARIYKKGGDLKKAMELQNEARMLDQADRYLNVRASRYMFRVNEIEQGNITMGPFSRDTGDGELNCHDMQTMWYETEVAAAYKRMGDLRMSLKNYNFIERHLEQIHEDQFDFHFYALRKFALNSYFDMIKMEDELMTNR